jgi:WD40 repeat protein
MLFTYCRKRRKLLVAGLLSVPLGAVLISCLSSPRNRPEPEANGGKTLAGHTLPVLAVAFSADGTALTSAAYVLQEPRRVEVMTWEVATGLPVEHRLGHPDAVHCLALAPAGGALAASDPDGTLWLWEAAAVTGRRLSKPRSHVQAMAFSGDGRQLATADFASVLTLWDVASRRLRASCRGPDYPSFALAFAPDGKALASGGHDGNVRLWDAATGKERGAPRWHDRSILTLAFSPDGQTLVSGGREGTVKLWDVSSGVERATLATAGEETMAAAFSPDGRTLALAIDRTVQLWDMAAGRLVARLEGHQKKVPCLAYAPDGRLLATGSYDQTVRLWDVARFWALKP